MTEEKKPLKVEFAPGCFDSFEGTQEELDELMIELESMFSTMSSEELENQSSSVNLEELAENGELSDEELQRIIQVLAEEDTNTRRLQ